MRFIRGIAIALFLIIYWSIGYYYNFDWSRYEHILLWENIISILNILPLLAGVLLTLRRRNTRLPVYVAVLSIIAFLFLLLPSFPHLITRLVGIGTLGWISNHTASSAAAFSAVCAGSLLGLLISPMNQRNGPKPQDKQEHINV